MKSRDQGLGIRGSGRKARGWGLVTRVCGAARFCAGAIVLVSTVIAGCPGLAQGKGGPEAPLTVKVRLFSYAPVSTKDNREAKREVELLFARLAIEIDWLDCRPPSTVRDPAACERPLVPGEIVLRILPDFKAARLNGGDTLGSAVVLPQSQWSAYASVFYDRVKKKSQSLECSRSVILGHAIAHEIGHLLLGTPEHSSRGIMRARWEREDLRDAARRCLVFDSEQANLIRHAVGVRRTVVLTSQNQR